MSEEKDKDTKNPNHLDVKYDGKHYKTEDGSYRSEVSAEATYEAKGKKPNVRHDPEDKKADANTRNAVRQPGMDSTHAQPAEQGAAGDTRNVAPFSHTMNRREIRRYETENEQMRSEGADVKTKGTFMYRADAEGNREAKPIALRHERETSEPGKESEKDKIYFGNFSTNKERAYQNAADGKPNKSEVSDAARKDNALYDQNRDRKIDSQAQAEWRNQSQEERRGRGIDGGGPPPRPKGTSASSGPPPRDRGSEPEPPAAKPDKTR